MPENPIVARDENALSSAPNAKTRWWLPYSYGPRRSDLWLELSVGLLFAITLIAPRGAFAYLALLLIVCCVAAWVRRDGDAQNADANDARSRAGTRRHSWIDLWIYWGPPVAFLLYAAISSGWSLVPSIALRKSAEAAVMLTILWLLIRVVTTFDATTCRFMLRGFVHGGIVGMAYLAIEHATDGALKAWAINATGLMPVNMTFNVVRDGMVVEISRSFLNRHSAVLAVLVWPLLFGVQAWLQDSRWLSRAVQITVVVAASLLFAVSNSETAKLAFIVGGLTFVAAQFRQRLTVALLALAWLVGTLAAPFLVASFALPAERIVTSYQKSAGARLEIWYHTVERTRDRPVIGHGAAMTDSLGDLEPPREVVGYRRLDKHAHNVFVQMWFELGVLGAVVLCVIGGAVLHAITRMPARACPWVLAQFAAVVSVASTGYGVWQTWLLAVYALAALFAVMTAHFSLAALRHTKTAHG